MPSHTHLGLAQLPFVDAVLDELGEEPAEAAGAESGRLVRVPGRLAEPAMPGQQKPMPVIDVVQAITSAGVPETTISPPLLPPPGPMNNYFG